MNEPIKAKIIETPKLPRRYIGVEARIDERNHACGTTYAYKNIELVKQCRHSFRDMTIYELPGSDDVPWTEERVREIVRQFVFEWSGSVNEKMVSDFMDIPYRLGVIEPKENSNG